MLTNFVLHVVKRLASLTTNPHLNLCLVYKLLLSVMRWMQIITDYVDFYVHLQIFHVIPLYFR